MSASRMDPRNVRLDPERANIEPIGIGDIRAQAAAEAQARVNRLRVANSTGSVRRVMPSLDGDDAALRLAAKLAERERVTEERIDREACTWCGVRADIGCKHRRAV